MTTIETIVRKQVIDRYKKGDDDAALVLRKSRTGTGNSY